MRIAKSAGFGSGATRLERLCSIFQLPFFIFHQLESAIWKNGKWKMKIGK